MNAVSLELIVVLLRDPSMGCQLSNSGWESLIHVLREGGLLGTLATLAERAGVLDQYPPFARRHLKSMLAYSARQAQQVVYECEQISVLLTTAGIQPVFLKGAGYTLRASQNARGRIYSDIDVLVAQTDLAAAQALLRQNLWYIKQLNEYDERYYREWAHEIPPMMHAVRHTVLDLHHNIVPPISGRAPDARNLLAGVETLASGLQVLSPAAAVLHSLVHLFTNEDFTHAFRDLVDIYLMVDEYANPSFWEELYTKAEQTGFGAELYLATTFLSNLFEVEIPTQYGQALAASYATPSRRLLIRLLLQGAVRPHHPDVCSWRDNFAINMVYLRGHWIKMPAHILVMHLCVKAWFSGVDKLFGKYQFDKDPTAAK